MYRNKTDLISIEGIHVDAGSLWHYKNELMVLDDADQYVTHLPTPKFIKV